MSRKETLHNFNWGNKITLKRSKKDIELNGSNKSIISILPKVNSVLDVGCGTGELMNSMQKQGIKTFGVDISSIALKEAQKNNLQVKKVDLDEPLPFKSNEFEAVICNQVLMHVFDPSFVISEMKRVSKKYVLINVPNHLYWRFRIQIFFGKLPAVLGSKVAHIRLFNKEKIKSILQENNLKIISESFTGKSIFPSLFATGFTFLCEKK